MRRGWLTLWLRKTFIKISLIVWETYLMSELGIINYELRCLSGGHFWTWFTERLRAQGNACRKTVNLTSELINGFAIFLARVRTSLYMWWTININTLIRHKRCCQFSLFERTEFSLSPVHIAKLIETSFTDKVLIGLFNLLSLDLVIRWLVGAKRVLEGNTIFLKLSSVCETSMSITIGH